LGAWLQLRSDGVNGTRAFQDALEMHNRMLFGHVQVLCVQVKFTALHQDLSIDWLA